MLAYSLGINIQRAQSIINSYQRLITLDLAFAEIANIAWKRIFIFKDNKETVLSNLKLAIEFMNTLNVRQVSSLIDDGIHFALNYGITFYDASFVVLAIRENAILLTTNLKLANAIHGRVKVITPA